MSSSTEGSEYSLVFADHDQNYYVIPVEAFARGCVPAERKAELEQAMREHDVTGYNPLLVGAAAGVVVTGAFAGGMVVGATLAGVAAGGMYYLATNAPTAPATNDSGNKNQ